MKLFSKNKEKNKAKDLPPIGTWARCLHTNEYHKIYAHDLVSDDPMALTCDNSGYWGAYGEHWFNQRNTKPEGVEE